MKVKMGAIVTDASGKLGGHSIGRGSQSHYLRNKGASNSNRTRYKQVVRNDFLFLCKQWRTLTQEQRNSWESAVVDWLSTDVFGDSLKQSGFGLFMKINIRIMEANGSPIVIPQKPVKLTLPINLTFGSSVGSQSFLFTWGGGAVPVNTAYVVRFTRGVSRGVTKWHKFLKKQHIFVTGQGTPQFGNFGYTVRYGRFRTNSLIGIELFVQCLVSGSRSSSIFIGTITS